MDEWEKYKKEKIEEYFEHKRKGKVDKDIVEIVETINQCENLITTSSCSGRIVLLEVERGKGDASFYKKWHRQIKTEELEEALKNYKGKKNLWFRCEPFILHITARKLKDAKKVLEVMKKAGIKRVGITTINKNVKIEAIGTNSLITPVECVGDWHRIAMYANTLLTENLVKIEKIKQCIRDYFSLHH